MTTTTPTKPTLKRPKLLILAAILMLLAAVLSLATPFLPRTGGAGGPGGPGGAPPANGQAPGAGTGGAQADPNFTPGQNGAPSGAPGQGTPPTGSGFGMMSYIQPARMGEAILGGLLALLAALGLWRLRKWGRSLAVLMAIVGLVSVVATLAGPLLGRSPWLMLLTGSTWPAIAGFALALVAAILALLPAARGAYIVKPKVRQVA